MALYVIFVISLIVGKLLGWFALSWWWIVFLVVVIPFILVGLFIFWQMFMGVLAFLLLWIAKPF